MRQLQAYAEVWPGSAMGFKGAQERAEREWGREGWWWFEKEEEGAGGESRRARLSLACNCCDKLRVTHSQALLLSSLARASTATLPQCTP